MSFYSIKTHKLLIFVIFLFPIQHTISAQSWIQKSKGIDGGVITSLLWKNNLIFAATEGARIFKSEDNGLTWKLSSNGIAGKNITSIVAKGNNLYAGSFSDGIYYSNDNGESWKLIINGLNNFQVACLLVSDDQLFAGTVSGIYKLNNDGISWSGLNNGLPGNGPFPYSWISSLIKQNDIIIAGSYGKGAYISQNNGQSWTTINNIPEDAFVFSSIRKDNIFFLGTNDGVYLSSNEGANWAKAGSNFLPYTYIRDLLIIDDTIYAATSDGLYFSSNNGSSWSKILLNNNFNRDQANALLINGSDFFVGTQTTLYHSNDNAATWEVRCNGISALPINNLTVKSKLVFASTDNGLYRSSDQGENWEPINISDNRLFTTLVKGDTLLAQGFYRTHFSTDDGSSWNFFPNTGISYSPKLLTINKGNIYGSSSEGVFVFKKDATTWEKLNIAPDVPNAYFSFMVSMDKSLIATSVIDGVFVSADDGASWTKSTNGLPSFIIPTSLTSIGNKIFLSTNEGDIFVSASNGISWEKMEKEFYDIRALYNAENYLIQGGGGSGVSFSPDEGITWINSNNEVLASLTVGSFASSGNLLYAGTSEGIWNITLDYFKPSITSFSPTSGNIGTTITLTGKNFSKQSSLNLTSINGIASPSTAVNSGTLIITVPSNVSSGPINVQINNNRTASSLEIFCLKPVKPAIIETLQANGEFILTSSSSIGNQWFFNDTSIIGATQQIYHPLLSGIYSVQTISTECSSDLSDGYNYIITAIEPNFYSKDLEVYPIPSSDKISINLKSFDEFAFVDMHIYDSQGNALKEWKEEGGKTITTSILSYSPGMYLFTATQASKTYKVRIIKH